MTIDPTRALARIEQATAALEETVLPLSRARGHVLSRPVTADRDAPPTDRSAMDGFALRAEDAGQPGAVLQVVGELPAGRDPGEMSVPSGSAVRIYTGAVMPAGADSVVMVEDTTDDRAVGVVRIHVAVARGQHVRPQGQDRRAGDAVLAPGTRLRAAEIAALATVGLARVPVHRRPRVAVLSTGDEIVAPEETPGPHQVRNSNGAMLQALLAARELETSVLGIAGDRDEALAPLLARGLEHDVLLVTGGVSVGDYDLVGETLERAGMRVLFHGVAVKPGKPILCGVRGGCLVFGLPGNPVSTACGFAVFVAPALRRLEGCRRWRNATLSARVEEPIRQRPGRQTYHLVEVEFDAGRPVARPVRSSGSGDVLALSAANGYLVGDAGTDGIAAGEERPVLLWNAPAGGWGEAAY